MHLCGGTPSFAKPQVDELMAVAYSKPEEAFFAVERRGDSPRCEKEDGMGGFINGGTLKLMFYKMENTIKICLVLGIPPILGNLQLKSTGY